MTSDSSSSSDARSHSSRGGDAGGRGGNAGGRGEDAEAPTAGEDSHEGGAKTGEGKERETWDRPIEFLLSCIAMSVGLGNFWRFPTTAYENGGGAFLLPYLLVLFFIGRVSVFIRVFHKNEVCWIFMSNLAFRSYSRENYLSQFLDCKVHIFMLRRATVVLGFNKIMEHNKHNRNTYVVPMCSSKK